MNKDNVLKKEFKKSDVERIRNLVKKDYSGSTKSQSGYKKSFKKYQEGDIWEENGKQWTIKNGIKQNITKLDSAKKAIRVPLKCPKCGGSMKHWLNKKMYKIHGFCFDPCTVKMEGQLRKAGLYEQYEKRMMQGNIKAFINDIDNWSKELVNSNMTFVTEDGVIEDWNSNTMKDQKFMSNLKEYIGFLSEHLK
jgi:hypothetical protein|tara:strand:- start:629 stop:1207 length:579 start_codon:yes stop_codon:yes gene_type:complete